MFLEVVKTFLVYLGQFQPRSQDLTSDGDNTIAGAGHVTLQNLIALGGVGNVSYYMFPLPFFLSGSRLRHLKV